MLCHIIVSVVHKPSHKWKESLFCGGFGRFWTGCRSLWHSHAEAVFKNTIFFKGQEIRAQDEKIQVDSESRRPVEGTVQRRKSGANPAQIRRKSGANPTQIRRKSGANPAQIRRKSGTNPAQIRRKSSANPAQIQCCWSIGDYCMPWDHRSSGRLLTGL